MKKAILFGILCLTIFSSFAQQQKNWVTKKIGQWSFEKFPIHYFVAPAKAISSRNLLTGKLESYTEYNQYGQQEGLFLIMRDDGIFPSGATYTYKGVTVYQVNFFPTSYIPESILNSNKDMADDGYQIHRHLKSSGGYTEEVDKYNNGELVERDGVKVTTGQGSSPSYTSDGLLNGNFIIGKEIEGEAVNGKLKRIKYTYDGRYSIQEITILKDSFRYRTAISTNDKSYFETYPIISNPTITNFKSNCLKYGNFNGYPFLYLYDRIGVDDIKSILERYYPNPFEVIVNYADSLLDGNFQMRIRGGSLGDYIDVTGRASKGKILELQEKPFTFDIIKGTVTYLSRIEYTFSEKEISKTTFSKTLPIHIEKIDKFEINNPVLLTNSLSLSGYQFPSSEKLNELGIPNNELREDKKGYVFLIPYNFYMSDFLKIISKQPKYDPFPIGR